MAFQRVLAASTAMVALSGLSVANAVASSSDAAGVARVLAAATVTNGKNPVFGTFTVADGQVIVRPGGTPGGSIPATGVMAGAFDFTAGDSTPVMTVILDDLTETGTGTGVLDVTSVAVTGPGVPGTVSGTAATTAASVIASATLTASSGTGIGIGGGIQVEASDAASAYAGALEILVNNN